MDSGINHTGQWASHGYHIFQFHRDNDHHLIDHGLHPGEQGLVLILWFQLLLFIPWMLTLHMASKYCTYYSVRFPGDILHCWFSGYQFSLQSSCSDAYLPTKKWILSLSNRRVCGGTLILFTGSGSEMRRLAEWISKLKWFFLIGLLDCWKYSMHIHFCSITKGRALM